MSKCRDLNHVKVIDVLRGIAVLWVVFYHYSFRPDFLDFTGLGSSIDMRYGVIGVKIFFVISGFVIPYALYRGYYNLKYFPSFFLKRIIRLDPSYLCAVAFSLFSLWHFPGVVPVDANTRVDLVSLAAHIGYVIPFIDRGWFNGVFWSLGVEFQYYLLLAGVFPFIISKSIFLRGLIVYLIAFSQLIPSGPNFFNYYSTIFCFGIVGAQYFIRLSSLSEFILNFTFLFLFNYFLGPIHYSLVGGGILCVILFLDFQSKILCFYGLISYSLYLFHNLTGQVIDFYIYKFSQLGIQRTFYLDVICFILTFVGSTLFAYIMFRFVEKPSRKFAGNIKYEPLREQFARWRLEKSKSL